MFREARLHSDLRVFEFDGVGAFVCFALVFSLLKGFRQAVHGRQEHQRKRGARSDKKTEFQQSDEPTSLAVMGEFGWYWAAALAIAEIDGAIMRVGVDVRALQSRRTLRVRFQR